jgi:hypothetical protein
MTFAKVDSTSICSVVFMGLAQMMLMGKDR